MIAVIFRDGKRWVWAEDDLVTLRGHELRIGDIAEFQVIEPEISVREGHVSGGGDQLRGLVLQDVVPIVVPLDLASAKALGTELQRAVVEVARTIPADLLGRD